MRGCFRGMTRAKPPRRSALQKGTARQQRLARPTGKLPIAGRSRPSRRRVLPTPGCFVALLVRGDRICRYVAMDASAFIRANTKLMPVALVPEIQLHLAEESLKIWRQTEEQLAKLNV